MKTCNKCGTEKPLDEFYLTKGTGIHERTCRACRYQRKRVRVLERRKTDDVPHGTLTGYITLACRCDECRDAHRVWKNTPRDTPKTVEHGVNRYVNHKCRCNVCVYEMRMWRLETKYSVTREWFDQAVQTQNGCCAICNSREELVVDHDHACCPGAGSCGSCVRGLICTGCNQAIGLMKDDPDILLAAAAYLLQSRNVLEEL